MSWFFVLTIIFSNGFYHAQSSSNSSSSSVMSSSSTATSSSSTATSSSSTATDSSSTATSSSAMSPSSSAVSPSSSSLGCGNFMDCGNCFDGNCTWDFALAGCINYTETMLPYPFDNAIATKNYCDMVECFGEFQHGMVHYKAVQDKWDSVNQDAMTTFSTCLVSGEYVNCNGTDWIDGNYSAMCTSNKTLNAEVCKYSNTYSWTSMSSSSSPMRLRLLLSSAMSSTASSSSSSAMSSTASSSSSRAMSSTASSSSSSPMSSMSSSSMSSSPMSSSPMSSSPMSSSAMSSSAMGSKVEFAQNYCFPSKCTDAFSKPQNRFDVIFMRETNFKLPSGVVSKPAYKCDTSGGGGNSLSTGAIVGIVVGVIIGLLLLGFLGFNMCRNKDDSGFQAM